MKKSLLATIIPIMTLIFFSSRFCEHVPEIEHGVGDVWTYVDTVSIRFDAVDYKIDIIKEEATFELTFTIEPKPTYSLSGDNVYIYSNPERKIFTSREKNIELNGYDILDMSISEKVQYAFYFFTSLDYFKDENGELMITSYPWGMRCNIFPANFAFTINI